MTVNVTLIGYKSSGKSTIARLYVEQFAANLLDTDTLILQKSSHQHISDFYKEVGEQKFRTIEEEVIIDVVKNLKSAIEVNHVIATGGGVVLNNINIFNLKKISKIIYLNTPVDTIITRLQFDRTPAFLMTNGINLRTELELRIRQDYQARQSLYLAASDYKIDTEGKSNREIIKEIRGVINS